MSTKLLKILIKESLLLENAFYNSPDADYPGRKQTVVFSSDEEYKIDGDTHGLESHAIKHYKEFAPSRIEAEMAKAKDIIQNFDSVFILNKKGVIVQTGDKAKNSINTNSLLNTFDLINDKQKNNVPLNDSEIALEPILKTLTKEYSDLISYYTNSCIDIDNIDDEKEIMQILDSGKIVKFTGKYSNTLFNYYMDPTNTGLVAQNLDGTFVTLFRIDKKGSDLNKVAGYFSRGVELTNLKFAKAIGILNERKLRSVIKDIIKEFSMRPTRVMPSGDDRKFAVSSLPKSSMQGGDVSQTDAVKLMSASTGFFQTLVDAIRFGFLTREEVNRICSSLESGCEDNFKSLVVSHPCLKWWKNDVSKIAARIGDDTDFKRDFCESVKSNCEMVRSNYNRALGNIKQISM